MKIDVFPMKREIYQLEEMQRRVRKPLTPRGETETWLASPEDTVLSKLDWYRLGGGVSDRQWGDVLGVIKVQGGSLNLDYLRQWAAHLRLSDLPERALRECDRA
jgi:hypothetical protein